MRLVFNPLTGALDYIDNLYLGALSSAPSTTVPGSMYFNTVDSTLYVYYGGWISIGSGTPPPSSTQRQLEDGTLRVLEDGTARYTE